MQETSDPERVTRVLEAWDRERARVATGLYADVAQRLSTALLYLEVTRKELARAGEPAGTPGPTGEDLHAPPPEALEAARTEAEEALEQVRRLARGLWPQELAELGPVAALEAYARGIATAHDLSIQVEAEPVDPLVGREAGAALYRVMQEALANAVRHADARRMTVRIRRTDDGGVEAVLDDDGAGFDLQEALWDPDRGAGFIQMVEQAGRAAGSVEVDSRPGGGTQIRVRVPLDR